MARAQEDQGGMLAAGIAASVEGYLGDDGAVPVSKKEYATLQAQLALRGYSLSCTHDAPGGCTTYTVARWNLSRTFIDIGSVRAFLIRILGVSA